MFIDGVADNLPASSNQMKIYRRAQSTDPECSRVKEYCRIGWPKGKIEQELMPYWRAQSYLTLKDDLLLYGSRIVVPTPLRKETLEKVHAGHQGRER